LKVLVIDDNQENIDVVTFFLELNGITCVSESSGKKGLEILRRESFDLVLLDLAIPDFSGIQIFDVLKEEGIVSEKNIIIFTASLVDQKEIDRLLDSGAKGIIHKPLAVEDLEELIKIYLRNN
jgi:DNA-binding response OmpR family regulator